MCIFVLVSFSPVAVLCMFSHSQKGCHCVLWLTLACYLFLKAAWFTEGIDGDERLQSLSDIDKIAVQL